MSGNSDAQIEAFKQMARRLLDRLYGSGGPDDPSAAVRVPRSSNPPGRAGAIALPEPAHDVRVDVVGRRSA